MKKIVRVSAIVLVFMIITIFISVTIMKNSKKIVEYNGNITVDVRDGAILGCLMGSKFSSCGVTRINVDDNDCLFFFFENTKWDDITARSDSKYEYILCFKEMSADTVAAVYYYSGDYDKLTTLSDNDLQAEIDKAILLWQK